MSMDAAILSKTSRSGKGALSGGTGIGEWMGFALLLAFGALLRLWGLDRNGTGNPYYAAAVRSMLESFHNLFFASFDPAGFVTVDKPPMALWIQTLFAKLLGYRGFTLILPQVLEGLASMAILYHLVRRLFGPGAGLFSALVLALNPVSVAVDRYNNTDACLVCILLLSAWTLVLALERGSPGLLFASMALVGVGFNTKMLAAFVVLPVFYLLYLVGSPRSLARRLGSLTLGTLVLLAVSLSWPLAVDLTPLGQRPYVGSTRDNSMIGLSLGWNGFQRLLARGRLGSHPGRSESTHILEAAKSKAGGRASTPLARSDLFRGRSGRRRGFLGSGTPGPLRLADKSLAGQVAWFLPLALGGFLSQGRRSPLRLPLSRSHQALALWIGWLLIYGAVFSFMRGPMHPYYLVLLTPPVAALSGIGLKSLCLDFQEGRAWPLLGALFLTLGWQSFVLAHFPDWNPYLFPILASWGGVSLLALLFLFLIGRNSAGPNLPLSAALGLGLVSLFLCPTLWALGPVLGSGQRVEADPDLLEASPRNPLSGGTWAFRAQGKLLSFLQAHHRKGQYLVVAQNSFTVAPLIIETGKSAVALGGFMGRDPILTVGQFVREVEEGRFRYMLLPNPSGTRERTWGGGDSKSFPPGRMDGGQDGIAHWVRRHGKPVNPALWRPIAPPRKGLPRGSRLNLGYSFGSGRDNLWDLQLYDLRPELGS
jgi:4-amino-4-deoxy-L-arabinose transferase-like glycosyltransferase